MPLPTEAAEAEAWRAWRAGDEAAFQLLYALTLPRLSSYCRTLAREEGAAADLFQETWQKALDQAAGFRGDCPVTIWLFGIARNAWISDRRHQAVARRDLLQRQAAHDEEVSEDPARALAWEEFLDALPAPQREAVALYHVQQRSLRDVARLLEVSHTEVLRRLKSAHEALRQKIAVPGRTTPASRPKGA